jgi:F0F1-type ATP synthase membrane subunit b/b'
MVPRRAFRSETEITETDGRVSYRRIVFWTVVALAIVVGVVSYFKYERLLAPLLG